MMEDVFWILLSILFACGVAANAIVLKCVLRAALRSPCAASSTTVKFDRNRERIRTRRKRDPKSPPPHVYVYIGALLISDLLLLMNCPFIIHDIISQKGWEFGGFLCKVVYGNESFHKVMTGFLLAALSFDQLITVRKIVSAKWRTVSTALGTIGCCAMVNILLQIPVIQFTGIHGINESLDNANETNYSLRLVEKCASNPPPGLVEKVMVILIFGFGFCLPTLVIIGSYGTIIYRMVASGYFQAMGARRRARTMSQTSQRSGTTGNGGGSTTNGCRLITWYVSLLVLIYICCWAPYWILIGLGFTYTDIGPGESVGKNESSSNSSNITANVTIDAIDAGEFDFVMLYIHLLPYLNATLNPGAYGYLVKSWPFKRICCTDDGWRSSSVANTCLASFCRKRGQFGRQDARITIEYSRGWSREETWARYTTTPKSKRAVTTVLNCSA